MPCGVGYNAIDLLMPDLSHKWMHFTIIHFIVYLDKRFQIFSPRSLSFYGYPERSFWWTVLDICIYSPFRVVASAYYLNLAWDAELAASLVLPRQSRPREHPRSRVLPSAARGRACPGSGRVRAASHDHRPARIRTAHGAVQSHLSLRW